MAEEKNDIEENSTEIKINVEACPTINTEICGNITETDENKANLQLKITSELISDSEGLAHNGFIYSAGAYVAQVAINKKNTCVIGSRTSFFAPAKIGDIISFEATAKFDNSKKREVLVKAYIREVCVFEGIFYVLVTDEHILKMQKSELAKYQSKKQE
ncbi:MULTISPECIES: hypothetical protein [unclassified Campylobacter]|uniref:PaaI family thioesterase n=1 Tax=unclassified Campylobacter TaxID=2593542 RepID=UPI001BDAD504|nr:MULTISPECIES: hypothetical protein [unclassified Campylobacter]MBZ7975988.1 hypothetical protein [Campylobacter sp. RM12637]MBZ7978869.1 hypothetical protein [Campylobacter sp. RM12654]MBZ7979789.1 hypothetical protein [Campylobacter sp. RM12642]MBZ7982703.1 hypothetical protein [Campylobacter sp. RM12640]MBZ7983436.1 hypothetical protein [Campylobacter sp. RM12647]MBZ7988842.1 hypothetical protein [Campylobacter sp. RM12635]MBZ7990983.1 hypothetical protein [Campylobacter sp. RM9331]MBZ